MFTTSTTTPIISHNDCIIPTCGQVIREDSAVPDGGDFFESDSGSIKYDADDMYRPNYIVQKQLGHFDVDINGKEEKMEGY